MTERPPHGMRAGNRTPEDAKPRRTAPDAQADRLMTGGRAIVEALIANRVEAVFGLPGAQMYALFDALQQRSDRIRTYGARHEQTCGYMALGYARSTGRPGVYAVVPGPGVLNTTAALLTAYGTCSPVLCLTGQVPAPFVERGRGHLHELADQLGTLRSMTKWSARIERPADAPALVNEAFRQMLSGRPGPVVLEMAWDVMGSTGEVEILPPAERPTPLQPAAVEIEAAASLIAAARRPMIFTGSGAQHASAEIRALAREIDAPVVAFRGGRGVMGEDDPLGISSYAGFELWPETDVAIAIGTRAELPYMRWTDMMTLIDKPTAPPHLVRIDINPVEMRRLVAHAGIVADAAVGTAALTAAVCAKRQGATNAGEAARTERRARIAEVKSLARRKIETVQPQLDYLDQIRAALPREGIIVTELCQAGFTSYFGYPVLEPRTYITEGYQGTLGFGFPTALGVKAAHPDLPVVSITGDGGFMFAVQELATAAQEGLAVVIVLFNNSAYGNVLRDQQTGFADRVIGSVLKNPDFPALATAFDVEAHRVDTPEALREVLVTALKTQGPVLIEVAVAQGSESSPWPFIHPKR